MTDEESGDPIAKELSASEAAYKTGDLAALLHAIHFCFRLQKPVPAWAVAAFIEAYRQGMHGQLKSWDDVFGHPRTRTQWDRMTKEFVAGPIILDAVSEAKANGKPIDDGLFERIGRTLLPMHRLGKTKIKQIYAYWRSALDHWR
jgi:hypothetical protein